MAGRPLGVRSLVRALARLSRAQIRKLLSRAKTPDSGKLERLKRQRDRHMSAVKKLNRQIALLTSGNGHVGVPGGKRRTWKLSAETRRKMSEAARRRYSKVTTAPAKKQRRKMSAETRAKMAEAAKRRWAKAKAAP